MTAALEIGGAVVRRTITARGIREEFDCNGGRIPVGTVLTREECAKFNLANLRSMRERRVIETWPVEMPAALSAHLTQEPKNLKFERHLVHRGRGLYDVIEGHLVNTKPLQKAEAEVLAADKPN